MLFVPFSMILVAMKFFTMSKGTKVCLCLTNDIRQLLSSKLCHCDRGFKISFNAIHFIIKKNHQSDIQKKLISDKPKRLKFRLKDCCIGRMFRNV